MKDAILQYLAANPGTIALLVSGALGVVGAVFGGLSAVRKRRVALAVYHGFHIVHDIGEEIEGEDAFDKAARVLDQANEWMVANGWRAIRSGEEDAASLHAISLSGQAKLSTPK